MVTPKLHNEVEKEEQFKPEHAADKHVHVSLYIIVK